MDRERLSKKSFVMIYRGKGNKGRSCVRRSPPPFSLYCWPMAVGRKGPSLCREKKPCVQWGEGGKV